MLHNRLIFSICCLATVASAMAFSGDPEDGLYTYSKSLVRECRTMVRAGLVPPVWKTLVSRSQKQVLDAPVITVTAKKAASPSGDPHDYVSWSRYRWAGDTAAKTQYKDGEVNTEQLQQYTDDRAWWNFEKIVSIGTLCWILSDDPKYSKAVATHVRAWMVSPETRMNPNFLYSQWSPDRPLVHTASGMIDLNSSFELWEMMPTVLSMPDFTESERATIRAWMSDFYTWCTTDPSAVKESKTDNNHAVYWHVTVACLADALGRTDAVRLHLNAAKSLIDKQIQADGQMPKELGRPDALMYTSLALRGWSILAQLGVKYDVDLWGYQSPNGGSIRAALDYAKPLLLGKVAINSKPIRPEFWYEPNQAYRAAATAYGKDYAAFADQLNKLHPESVQWKSYFVATAN